MEVLSTHIKHIGTCSFREIVLFYMGIVPHTKENKRESEKKISLVTSFLPAISSLFFFHLAVLIASFNNVYGYVCHSSMLVVDLYIYIDVCMLCVCAHNGAVKMIDVANGGYSIERR